jgi:hypothetical protein
MALVKDPVARARKANTKLAAARLHLELESELGLNDDAPQEWESEAEEAIAILEAKAGEQDWGDLRDAPTINPETGAGWTPSLSRRASGKLGQPDEPDRPAEKSATSPGSSQDGHHERRRARARSARQRHAAHAAASSALDAADNLPGFASARQLASVAAWGALGLSLLYLLLRDSENPRRGWPSAVQAAVSSITNGVMAIVRPVDPLNPRGAAPAPASGDVQGRVAPAQPTSRAAGRSQTNRNITALNRRPGFRPAPVVAVGRRRTQSNVLGPRLPNLSTLLTEP